MKIKVIKITSKNHGKNVIEYLRGLGGKMGEIIPTIGDYYGLDEDFNLCQLDKEFFSKLSESDYEVSQMPLTHNKAR